MTRRVRVRKIVVKTIFAWHSFYLASYGVIARTERISRAHWSLMTLKFDHAVGNLAAKRSEIVAERS